MSDRISSCLCQQDKVLLRLGPVGRIRACLCRQGEELLGEVSSSLCWQGKDLFMDLDEGSLKLLDPESLTLLNTQPIHTIRVWGVGRDNGKYVARPLLPSLVAGLSFY